MTQLAGRAGAAPQKKKIIILLSLTLCHAMPRILRRYSVKPKVNGLPEISRRRQNGNVCEITFFAD